MWYNVFVSKRKTVYKKTFKVVDTLKLIFSSLNKYKYENPTNSIAYSNHSSTGWCKE